MVVAVIGTLIGILMTALSSVRESGRGLQCRNNLRQMTLAAQAYALDEQYFPVAFRTDERSGQMIKVSWDWVMTYDDEVISPGALWQYTGNPDEVHQCPSYKGPPGPDPFTGYNYNTSYLGAEGPMFVPGWEHVRHGATYAQCRRTTSCAIFGCGGFAGGANKYMRAPLHPVDPYITYAGGQAFRHRNGTNIAFIDGHVGSTAAHHPGINATNALLDQVMGYPENGFLSDDDSAYDPRR